MMNRHRIICAGIGDDKEGPLFRPMKPDGSGLERRHLDRKTPWRLVKKYCKAAGIDPLRLGGRGIGIHSLRKTAINDAIRNGAHDARGTRVRRARGYQDDRGLLRAQGGGRRGGSAADPDPRHGTHEGVSPRHSPLSQTGHQARLCVAVSRTETVRPEGPNPGEGRGRVQSRRGSFATPSVTWTGISSSGVIGSIPMRLGINGRRQFIKSDGSHLGNPG